MYPKLTSSSSSSSSGETIRSYTAKLPESGRQYRRSLPLPVRSMVAFCRRREGRGIQRKRKAREKSCERKGERATYGRLKGIDCYTHIVRERECSTNRYILIIERRIKLIRCRYWFDTIAY